MADARFLDWPFFEDHHRALARELEIWAAAHVPHTMARTWTPNAARSSRAWVPPAG
jgi:hypothetical protein